MRTKITRALLSVYDKTGIVEFARELQRRGIELVSSGGTATAIAEAGIPVTAVEDISGVPPILVHRVVTLHPKALVGVRHGQWPTTTARPVGFPVGNGWTTRPGLGTTEKLGGQPWGFRESR